MRYYLDTEFDGRYLISMGLVAHDGRAFYATIDRQLVYSNWVAKNVIPILYHVPTKHIEHYHRELPLNELPEKLMDFFGADEAIHIVTDWPSDVMFMADALLTGPGTMIDIPRIAFEVVRVDAYPTQVPGAVQHNAYWDAVALYYKLMINARLESYGVPLKVGNDE